MEKREQMNVELQFINIQMQAVQLQVENLALKRENLIRELQEMEAAEAAEEVVLDGDDSVSNENESTEDS